MILHVISPAASYVEGGTETDVALRCNVGGILIPKYATPVIIRIQETPFSVEEILTLEETDIWNDNVIYATRIASPCDSTLIYVTEYVTDVQAGIDCCKAGDITPPADEPFWIDADESTVTDVDPDDFGVYYNSPSRIKLLLWQAKKSLNSSQYQMQP